MASDEYQIPELYNELEIRAQINSIQFEVKPEYEARGQFQFIKDIETEIYAMRERAAARQVKPKSWLKGIVMTPQAPTLHELIEQESRYGGKIFGKDGQSKFWLDEKQSNASHGEGDEWFFQQHNPATPKQPTVLRFQTTANQIHKLYNGNEYPLTPEDTKSFTEGVTLYKSAIAQLYFEPNDTV